MPSLYLQEFCGKERLSSAFCRASELRPGLLKTPKSHLKEKKSLDLSIDIAPRGASSGLLDKTQLQHAVKEGGGTGCLTASASRSILM